MPRWSEGQGLHYNALSKGVPPERTRRKTAYLKNPCFCRVTKYTKNPDQTNVAGELRLGSTVGGKRVGATVGLPSRGSALLE